MILYHGSNISGIKVLEPKLADHDRPYVYMTTIEIVAGFYLVNAVERPYYWFPYGFDKEGNVVYHELYPNALREVSEGRSGTIYIVDADEKDVIPFKNIPCARLGIVPMKVISYTKIDDCYKWLLEKAREGKFKICKYEDKTKQQMQGFYNMIYSYIKEKNMITIPDCSYARFVREKFPNVWEDYMKDCQNSY